MRNLRVWATAILILTANLFATPFALSNQGPPHIASQPIITPLATNPPSYVVSLDANSVSPTDTSVVSSASQSKSFRIGAVINSSSTNPLRGIYAWQFGIIYNASAFVPQGDPGTTSYPDGAVNYALAGAQSTAGSVNWAAKVAATNAIMGSTICSPGCQFTQVSPPYRELEVYLTLLNPTPNVTISANTILANVNFELLTKPSTPQIFNITDVVFVTQAAARINGTMAGLPVFETITNAPPVASFTATPDPIISPTAFIFNGSASHDPDGTIPSPGGYFWDFGDGTQSLGTNGSIVIHDYGVNASFTPTLRVQDNLGATGSARDGSGNPVFNNQPSHTSQTLGPDEPPTAIFTWSSFTNSTLIIFDGSASSDPDGTIISYHWDFGDNSSLTTGLATISHLYSRPGNYSVTLDVTDIENRFASFTLLVPVSFITDELPTAAFTWTPSSNLAISFNGASSSDPDGSISYWQWAFGDGNFFSSSGPTALHTYAHTGNYSVTLMATDSSGHTNSVSHVVSVTNSTDEAPTAVFTWFERLFPLNNSFINVDFVGTFSSDPDGYIVSWNWNFGNGGSLSGPHPIPGSCCYVPGNYTVTLTIVDSNNQTATVSHIITVTQIPSDEEPIIALTISPITQVPGSPVNFDASASYDTDGTIVSWFWLFGDGTAAYGSQVSHTYSSAGTYVAYLTITDSSGFNLGTQITLNVQSDELPTANIIAFPSTPSVGQQVSFTGSASDPDGYIQNWSWNFGDGYTGNGQYSAHTYANPGSYLVTLTVTDSSGLQATSTLTVQVIVDESPTASIMYTPHNITAGQTAFFTGNATDPDGFIQSYSWNFGDNPYNQFGQYTTHTFLSPGNYTVTLRVYDSNGQFGTATTVVNVHPRPPHDVSISSVYASPNIVVSSQPVGINIDILNNGANNETVSVTAYYGPNVAGTLNNIFVQALSSNCYYCNSVYVTVLWDTTGVPAGNYTISATVFLATDPTRADNTMSDGKVQVLPPPVLTDNPSTGPVGTTLVLSGSNFPTPFYRSPIGYVEVTYDDQLIGFINSYNGSFTFTFSIPLSQPGQHWIKALDEYSGAHVKVAFQVTSPSPTGNLSVTVQVGTVYFPGDTAVVYAQVSLNGLLTNPSSLQLVLYNPNGSNQTLTLQSMGVGLFKTSYLVPKTGSIGTYLLVAKAHTTAPLDASQTASFEVKQSWLTQGGPAIAGGVTTATLVGLVAFAWKKGYFKKKEDDPLSAF